MTREEAIKVLENTPIAPMDGYSFNDISDALYMAVEALQTPPISQRSMYQAGYRQALKDRPKGEWIPVSERLPSESDYYLVTNIDAFEEKEVCVIWFAHKTDYGVSEWRETTDEDTILAWMPLPKPYKGGEDE